MSNSFVIPWTAALQASLSVGLEGQAIKWLAHIHSVSKQKSEAVSLSLLSQSPFHYKASLSFGTNKYVEDLWDVFAEWVKGKWVTSSLF